MPSKHCLSVGLSERQQMVLAEKHQISMAWLGCQVIVEFIERHCHENLQFPLRLTTHNRGHHAT